MPDPILWGWWQGSFCVWQGGQILLRLDRQTDRVGFAIRALERFREGEVLEVGASEVSGDQLVRMAGDASQRLE